MESKRSRELILVVDGLVQPRLEAVLVRDGPDRDLVVILRAPEIRRGIQFQDWKEIADGVLLSLEQTENYERERGPEGSRDKWHDRSVGIDEPTRKGVGKWMPAELMKLAERQTKK